MSDFNFRFDKGDEVRDKITDFTGIVVARADWLHGCERYGLQSRELKDGRPLEIEWFDVDTLELAARQTVAQKETPTGGPCADPKRDPGPGW